MEKRKTLVLVIKYYDFLTQEIESVNIKTDVLESSKHLIEYYERDNYEIKIVKNSIIINFVCINDKRKKYVVAEIKEIDLEAI